MLSWLERLHHARGHRFDSDILHLALLTYEPTIGQYDMTTSKESFILSDGRIVAVQEPVIISASRSTDIPAFYCDWFFSRLKIGYSVWKNPFNGVPMAIKYDKTRFIVFWSKNPRPLLKYIPLLKERGIGCYIQYSLNDYEEEGLEKSVPPLSSRIDTFKLLVKELGVGGVIWRFDPLVLTDEVDENKLLEKIERIGDQLKGYTEKLVFSFVDIKIYKKVQQNLKNSGTHYIDWNERRMVSFAKSLVELNKKKGWNYKLATCGEAADLEGIEHNHCIDDELIIRRAYHDIDLMTYLKATVKPMPETNLFGETEKMPKDAILLGNGKYAIRGNNKDKGQRTLCGCIKSKDIGQYDTCIHQCEYCYANTSKESAYRNYECHKNNPFAETITGN